MWFRVFGASAAPVKPAAVLEHLTQQGFEVTGHFRGDEEGWFHADILFGGEAGIELERYLSSEEGIRAELNTWAAWLETQKNPQQLRLMQQMISTKQLFTIVPPAADDELALQICQALCRFLATGTAGLYQIDGRGFFDVEGRLLAEEKE